MERRPDMCDQDHGICERNWQTSRPQGEWRSHSQWRPRQQEEHRCGRQSERSVSTCRSIGCDQDAISAEGFCGACKATYDSARAVHERELATAAAKLGRENADLLEIIVANPVARAVLLSHAAAHNELRGNRSGTIPAGAVRDFLDEAMESMARMRRRS